jgi:hypothetical protein
MIEQHCSESSIITGSSTHNERIERLWRDVFRCVISLFYNTFKALEEEEKLDPLNEVDIFCLHLVYKPRINHALKEFVISWNNHAISTEHNHTPNQLFVEGFMERDGVPITPQTTQSASNVPAPQGDEAVGIPRVNFEPCNVLQQSLDIIRPLGPTTNYGVDLYFRVINIVGTHLSQGCTGCS